jgi:hypothetical protein
MWSGEFLSAPIGMFVREWRANKKAPFLVSMLNSARSLCSSSRLYSLSSPSLPFGKPKLSDTSIDGLVLGFRYIFMSPTLVGRLSAVANVVLPVDVAVKMGGLEEKEVVVVVAAVVVVVAVVAVLFVVAAVGGGGAEEEEEEEEDDDSEAVILPRLLPWLPRSAALLVSTFPCGGELLPWFQLS